MATYGGIKMYKILDLLKRRLTLSKIKNKEEERYFVDIIQNQITEEEYNLILNFLNSEDEQDEQHN